MNMDVPTPRSSDCVAEQPAREPWANMPCAEEWEPFAQHTGDADLLRE